MKSLDFFIPGEPKAKQRPQFNSLNKQGYTPIQTINYENYVKMFIYDKWDKEEIVKWSEHEPLFLSCISYHKLPKNKSKKYSDLLGLIYPTCKPDFDNIAKIVTDAMNGLVFPDDSQIVGALILKRYAPPGTVPGVRVRIQDLFMTSRTLLFPEF